MDYQIVPYIEAFNGRFRDELLNMHCFSTIDDARQKVDDWRDDYNTTRAHSSIGMETLLSYLNKGYMGDGFTGAMVSIVNQFGGESMVRVLAFSLLLSQTVELHAGQRLGLDRLGVVDRLTRTLMRTTVLESFVTNTFATGVGWATYTAFYDPLVALATGGGVWLFGTALWETIPDDSRELANLLLVEDGLKEIYWNRGRQVVMLTPAKDAYYIGYLNGKFNVRDEQFLLEITGKVGMPLDQDEEIVDVKKFIVSAKHSGDLNDGGFMFTKEALRRY